ncbi:hypothetical protein, partial [Micrococcus sp.]|uniref:hypothetical protein n=1 Tax=Micrococcus sp. TaxID=1271 RepID=UPI0026DC352B
MNPTTASHRNRTSIGEGSSNSTGGSPSRIITNNTHNTTATTNAGHHTSDRARTRNGNDTSSGSTYTTS